MLCNGGTGYTDQHKCMVQYLYRYEGLGCKISRKKRYITLEWALLSVLVAECTIHCISDCFSVCCGSRCWLHNTDRSHVPDTTHCNMSVLGHMAGYNF